MPRTPNFTVNDVVTYYRQRDGRRVPARIIADHGGGLFDLKIAGSNEIKYNVPQARHRKDIYHRWATVRPVNWSILQGGGTTNPANNDHAQAAVAAWKASSRVNDRLLKDLSGNGHHMYFGSAKAAAIIDGALVSPGVSSAYASTPHQAAFTPTGDIEMVALIQPSSWRPAALSVIMAHDQGGTGQRSWYLLLQTGGLLRFGYSLDGSAVLTPWSTAAVPVGTGALWIKVNRIAASGVVNYYTSSDGSIWTALGSPTSSTAGAISPGPAQVLEIGSNATGLGSPFQGRISYAELRNGIDGPVVAAFDARDKADGTTTWVGPQGNVWTVNSPAVTTNDPQPLDFDQVNGKCAYFPGTTGNYISTPDQAALDITGDIDVRVRCALDSWTPATDQSLIEKRSTAANGSFGIRIQATSGLVNFLWNVDGVTTFATPSSVAPAGFSAGSTQWVRATRVAATGIISFYTAPGILLAPAASDWVQLGNVASATAGNLWPATGAPIEIGSELLGTSRVTAGKIYKAEVRNGINGPVVASFDASQWSEPFQTANDAQGNVWTANRSTSGRKLAFVDRTMLLLGTDDYLEALDHADFNVAPGDSFTVIGVYRTYDTTAYQVVMSKYASIAGEGGWEAAHSNATANVGGGFIDSGGINRSVYSPANSLGMGNVVAQALIRSVPAAQIQTYLNTVLTLNNDTTTATLVNTQVVRIGRRTSTGGNYSDMEFVAAAIFRRALSAAEIQQVVTELVQVGT